MKENTLDSPTYTERSDKVNHAIIVRLVKEGLNKIEEAMDVAKAGANEFKKSCNLLSAAGKDFTDAEAQGQSAFKFYFEEMKRDNFLKATQALILVNGAKKIHRMMPEPAKSFSECRPVIQLTLEVCGQMNKARRLEKQTRHVPNLWNDLVHELTNLDFIQAKFEEAEPMTGWPVDRLETFVHEVEPITKRYAVAKALLETKSNA